MDFEFSGEVFQWRGPAPFYYVALPEQDSVDLKEASAMLTYGWGVIPVVVRIGRTEWETSLFPRDGLYLVPLKDKVRRAEGIDDGDVVRVRMTAGGRQ
ncbi:MAG: DUF1905 domain-containing protein [Nocardioides sp.]